VVGSIVGSEVWPCHRRGGHTPFHPAGRGCGSPLPQRGAVLARSVTSSQYQMGEDRFRQTLARAVGVLEAQARAPRHCHYMLLVGLVQAIQRLVVRLALLLQHVAALRVMLLQLGKLPPQRQPRKLRCLWTRRAHRQRVSHSTPLSCTPTPHLACAQPPRLLLWILHLANLLLEAVDLLDHARHLVLARLKYMLLNRFATANMRLRREANQGALACLRRSST
jgi:hypothetical protein